MSDFIKHAYRTATGRGATLTVAANDSSALSKQQADYVCDGTADDVQIQAAIDALGGSNGGTVLLLEGTFVITTMLSCNYNDITIKGMGLSTILDASNASAPTNIVQVSGNASVSTYAVNTNVSSGQKDIVLNDATGLAVDDWIRIRSEVDYCGGGDTKEGEMHKIESISTNTVTVYDYIMDSYLVADTATLDKMTVYENISIANFKIIGRGSVVDQIAIKLDQIANYSIKDVSIEDAYNKGIDIYDGAHGTIHSCIISRSEKAGAGYGVSIVNCTRDITVFSCVFSRCRHAVSTGGNGTYGVNRNIVVDGNMVHGSSQLSGAFNTHKTSENVVISNNAVYDDRLADIRSPVTIVIGNTCISSSSATGIAIYGSASRIIIIGNYLKTNNNGIDLVANGMENIEIINNTIDVGGSSNNGIKCYYSINDLNIKGNTITSALYHGININTHNGDADFSRISIENNTIHVENRNAIIIGGATAYNIVDVCIIGNVLNKATGTGVQLCFTSTGKTRDLTIVGNHISGSGGNGIYLKGIDTCLIETNNIFDKTIGIYVVSDVLNCDIKNNKLHNCATSISDSSSSSNIYYNKYTDLLMDVLAVSATHVRSNEDLSAATPITFTLDAQPDVPRTLSWSFDSHAQITEYDMEVIGIDAKGNTVTETWDETAGWSGETSNAFATITSIKMTSRTGTGVADTMDIGITDVLGLSNIIYETSDVFKIKKNNANATVATAQVNTTYDTYDMSVIGLGAGDDFTIWYKSNLNIIT